MTTLLCAPRGSADAAPPGTPLAGSDSSASPTLDERRVLVVEDEMAIGLDLTIALEDRNAEPVGPVPSLTRASEMLDGLIADGLARAILDVRLTDGVSLPIATRLAEAGVPFVFYTAYTDETATEVDRYGVPVLRKPSPTDDVLDELADQMNATGS